MTELIWEGKYDKDGQKVPPLRVSLPFQTVETINESVQERQRALDLFASGRDSEWRDRLIWGDKKYVLPSLLDEFAGKVNLIYIDPPFNVGADFSFTTTIPAPEDEEDLPGLGDPAGLAFTKEPSIIEQKAYRDTWGRGLDSYLQWFYETAVLLRELLAEDGGIYVHLDYHIGHYAKAVMDEVFGQENFKNEVVWKRSLPHNDPKKYGSTHDVIFFYTRGATYIFNQQFIGLSEEYKESHYNQVDENGRWYQLTSLSASGSGPVRKFGDKTLQPPKGTHWRYSQEKIDALLEQGRIVFTSGGSPRYIRYMDEMRGPALQSIWTDVYPVNSQAEERLDYATQKPEALLERIIKASSNEGDLVLDCFCGSGTTAAVAEKLNRRWITCDLGRFAIHTTRKRLLSIPNVRPFVVQNLGKYERQVWQAAEFAEDSDPKGFRRQKTPLNPSGLGALHRAYTEFILKLYGARPVTGHQWLQGLKAGRMVHVGAVDAPVTVGDVTHIVTEFKKAMGSGVDAPTRNGVDVLGWDFAFELNEVARQQAARANLNLKFIRIPREVLDKQAVAQGDIHFFELAALSVDVQVGANLRVRPDTGQTHRSAPTEGRTVTLTLTDFVIPPDDVPEEVQKAVKHWAQWIDYWAVDWDNVAPLRGDTFHNEWQAYRTRKERDLTKTAAHTYEESGEYNIVIKVIDILGNDTTKTVKVEVK